MTAQWKRGKVILKDWNMDILKKTFSSKEAMQPQETIQGQLARQDLSKESRRDGFKADKRREGVREKRLSCKDGKVSNMVRGTLMFKTCKAVYECYRRTKPGTHHNDTQTQRLPPIM